MKPSEYDIPHLLSPGLRVDMPPDPYETRLFQVVKDLEDLRRGDVALLGVPFDGAKSVGRPGARFAPTAIRDALLHRTTYNADLDVDLASGPGLVDAGDVDIRNTDPQETFRRVTAVVRELLRRGALPLALGGDHSVTFPLVRGHVQELEGRLGIVVFDAHFDVRVSHHGEMSSGVPFRYILEELGEAVRGENLVEIGIHGWNASPFYRDYVRKQGIHVIPASRVHQEGMTAVLDEAVERATDGTEALYVSVDLDAVDQVAAPGVSAPSVGGLTPPQLLVGAFALGRRPEVRGFDIAEVAPPLDVQNLTSRLAAEVALHFVAGVGRR